MFNLQSTYETLEGAQNLDPYEELQLLEHTLVLARDQGGCRYLQQRVIEADDPKVFKTIFEGAISHFPELMGDPFGNYLTQKLMEKASPAELTRVIKVSQPFLVQLCKEMHGTRSIQKLIDCAQTESNRMLIAAELEPHIRFLSREINGNHVLVRILQTWKEK